jgi:hypothetical protein
MHSYKNSIVNIRPERKYCKKILLKIKEQIDEQLIVAFVQDYSRRFMGVTLVILKEANEGVIQ